MTTQQRRREAQRLKAEGLRVGEIARRFGVTPSAVSKWLMSDAERRDMSRRHNAGSERKAAKKAHAEASRVRCPGCGEMLRIGSGYPSHRSQRCAQCVADEARFRTARWLELRRAGLGNREIAEREGVTTSVVTTQLSRARVGRYPELTWIPSPYAAARGVQ